MKTLEDFKQEVAEKYRYGCFDEIISMFHLEEYLHQAAELYAEYKEKEAWNEALHWAAENAEATPIQAGEYWIANVIKESILEGLKP